MNSNVEYAIKNYLLWLKNYPMDYKGATEAAGDFLDTPAEVEQFITAIKSIAGQL